MLVTTYFIPRRGVGTFVKTNARKKKLILRGLDFLAAEIECARPQTVGEEELQLQLALAMSREEAEQEEQKRRSDDVRLQLALSQSEKEYK